MSVTLNMAYWHGEHFWFGKLVVHPEIMSQGETLEELEELEENLRDAYREMWLDDVPPNSEIRDFVL